MEGQDPYCAIKEETLSILTCSPLKQTYGVAIVVAFLMLDRYWFRERINFICFGHECCQFLILLFKSMRFEGCKYWSMSLRSRAYDLYSVELMRVISTSGTSLAPPGPLLPPPPPIRLSIPRLPPLADPLCAPLDFVFSPTSHHFCGSVNAGLDVFHPLIATN